MSEGYSVKGTISTQNIIPASRQSAGNTVAPDGSVAAFGQVLEQNIQRQDAVAAQSQALQSQAQQAAAQTGLDENTLLLYALMGSGMGGEMGTMLTAALMEQLLDAVAGQAALPVTDGGETGQVADAQAGQAAGYGSQVLELAYSRLGSPYSQAKAGLGDYVDCSYLTQWCYRQVGLEMPRTAAEQARYCVEGGLTVTKEELQPGDLVFFSDRSNGRYMNITHVGVYAGDGMMVDASSRRGEVVYREMYGGQVLYARPSQAM